MTDDSSLLEKVAAGDSQALSLLYDEYAGLVYSMARRIVRDENSAETVVQQVFTTIWRKAGRYDSTQGSASTWILTIARNRAIDELRKTRRLQSREIGWTPDVATVVARSEENSPLTGLMEKEFYRTVREALQEIPEPQKAAIHLNFYDGLSHREIAEILNEPLGTIKSRIQLGLDKMRSKLSRYFGND